MGYEGSDRAGRAVAVLLFLVLALARISHSE
jgi:hypothetical protein